MRGDTKEQPGIRFLRGFGMAALATALISCVVGWLLIHAPVGAEYWVAETLVVKRELARRWAGQPKVIVAGGSSVLYGVDAESATQQLQRPVLNFGLHAGLRLESLLREVEQVTETGDAVVLALEPPFYTRTVPWNAWQVRNAIAWDYASWEVLSVPRKLEFLGSISPRLLAEMVFVTCQSWLGSEIIQQRLAFKRVEMILDRYRTRTKPSEFRLSADHLNEHGDLLCTEGGEYQGPSGDLNEPRWISKQAFDCLAHFVQTQKTRGVRVCFAHPPYLAFDGAEASESAFRTEISGLGTLIDRRGDLVFGRADFFDGPLHLNASGREQRTARLVRSLRPWLSPEAVP
jgi:hypothetical protein